MVYSRSYTSNECFCSSFSPLQYELVLYRILIESFRFEEVEVVHARKPASFFGKNVIAVVILQRVLATMPSWRDQVIKCTIKFYHLDIGKDIDGYR